MKRILISLLLTSTAHAATVAKAKVHMLQAKQNLASARAELKAAKTHERSEKRTRSKARTLARAKARLAKAQGVVAHVATDDAALGCGTCIDTHDGACTCPPVDHEDQCRAIARTGESWEDACDRVFGVQTDPASY